MYTEREIKPKITLLNSRIVIEYATPLDTLKSTLMINVLATLTA